ncbi:hypothetical protein J1614_002072 [Plenodomus biglobosus]|nr:hypothetical protein J1614_002072 [Plenodomus biglobosus]
MDPNSPLPRPTVEQLRHVANNYPIIDSHAHNLILPTHSDSIPFETITTGAQGRALRDTFKTLSHLRAARQLRGLYECGEDADWEDILEQRTEWLRSDPERLHQRCFKGVHALLIDDGIAGLEKVFPYEHHDQYTRAPCKRIVRIETVAERIMERLVRRAKEDDLGRTKFLPDTWIAFTDDFEGAIQDAITDPEVAAFKTVICYRTGLDIEPEYEEAAKAVGHPFERYVKNCIRKRSYRIEKKALNDYIVLRTLEILSEQVPHSDAFAKPLQFHTGLGDNDISLLESNPAFLQPLIENYPTVPFVLLHSAYPYTREAGYLATVYRHVYLDIGKVFPMLSRDGQGVVLRQAMELVPGSKLMYSSGGNWFPETFWLANTQFREVWLEGDLTPFQAMGMTKDILFNNANVLYNLHYEAVFDDRIAEISKQLTYNTKFGSDPSPKSPIVAPIHHSSFSDGVTTLGTPAARSDSPYSLSSFPPPPKVPQVYNIQFFDDFKQKNHAAKFVYVQWLDYVATVRARVVTMKEFERMIRAGERMEINTSTLKNDSRNPIIVTTGPIYMEPDLRSLRKNHDKDPLPSATAFCYWRNESGNALVECPRNSLEIQFNGLQHNYATSLLVGFEIKVTFLNRGRQNVAQHYSPLTTAHTWSTLSPEQWLKLPFLSEIVLALEQMDINVQQFHAESGQGEYRFMLAPLPALRAVDTLIQARQVISQIAAQHDMRATLHSKPFEGIDTAVSAHISLQPPDLEMQFFAGGVQQHLPALCAFTMPCEESYGRVFEDNWIGRTGLASGTQGRETPLRRISPGHWEIRTLDGLANMYLALSSIIAAGLLGVESSEPMIPQQDLPINLPTPDVDRRKHDGVLQKLPRDLREALDALKKDSALNEAMAHGLVQHYVTMKESEMKMLGEMEEGERRVFLIERY